MKNPIKIILGVFVFASLHATGGAQTTYINETFETQPLGALTTGTGTQWRRYGNVAATIVSTPADVHSQSPGGSQSLQLSSDGTLLNLTSASPNTPFTLAPSMDYQWSFYFKNDSTGLASSTQGYVYLNQGVNDTVIGGLQIRNNTVRYLSSGIGAIGQYADSGVSITLDTWYKVSFAITTDDSLNVSYHLTLTELGSISPLFETNINSLTTSADGIKKIEMGISTQSAGTMLYFDDVYLASVPEPNVASLFLFLGISTLAYRVIRRKH